MDTIIELKFLELAHNIASCCDYVPEYSDEMKCELHSEILEVGYSKQDIEHVLKNYEGYSDGDVVSIIMSKIKNLKN